MPRKYMVIGDLHATHETLPVIKKLFKKEVLRDHYLIFLGDIFHSLERKIDAVLLLELQECFMQLTDFPNDNAIAVMGNHDMLHGSYTKIRLLPNIIPVTEPIVTKASDEVTFVCIPWMKPEAFEDLPSDFLETIKTPGTIVFSHLPLANSDLAKFGKSISLEHFRGASMVFNGHWHQSGVTMVGDTPVYNVGSYAPMSTTEIKTYMPSFPTFTAHPTLIDTLNSVRLNNNGEVLNPVHIKHLDSFDPIYNRDDCIIVLSNDDTEIIKQYTKAMRVVTPKMERLQLATEVSYKVKSLDKTQLIATLLQQHLKSETIDKDTGVVLNSLIPSEFGGQGATETELNDLLSGLLSNLKDGMEDIFNRELKIDD